MKRKLPVRAATSLLLSALLFRMSIGVVMANSGSTVDAYAEESNVEGETEEGVGIKGSKKTEESTETEPGNSGGELEEEMEGGMVLGNEIPKPECIYREKYTQYSIDKDCEAYKKDYSLCEHVNSDIKITTSTPSRWHNDTTKVHIPIEDVAHSGSFTIKTVQVKVTQNGNWTDVTEDMHVEISENITVYVLVTDRRGKTYEKNRHIKCFDFTEPTLNVAVSDSLLNVQTHGTDSGIKAVCVNGYEFMELTNGVLNIRLQQSDAGCQYFTISVMDHIGNMSEAYKTANPYYTDPEKEDSSEKNPAEQLPVNAQTTKSSSTTTQVTEYAKTDSDRNTVSELSPAEQKKQAMAETAASEEKEESGEKEKSEAGKGFYIIQTASEKVSYLITDRDREEEMVYFLMEVTENDLLNVTADNSETLPKNSTVPKSAIPTAEDVLPNNNGEQETEEELTEKPDGDGEENTEEPEPEPEKARENPMVTYIILGVVAVIAIGDGYHFRVVREKKGEFLDEDDDEEDEEEEYEDDEENEDNEDDFFEDKEGEDEQMQLVITEEPSAARSTSEVIGATEISDGYMEGNGYTVNRCMGYLVELAQPESYGEQWKKWTYESLPVNPEKWQYEVKSGMKAQYDIFCQLIHRKDVTATICATDAGREGELISRLVYEMAGCDKPIKRLWVSLMEESATREGFENLQPESDYDNLYHSTLRRQEVGWFMGINGTRLFTVLYGGKVPKVGRVRTSTLAILVDREAKIMNFQKEKYYMAHILMDGIDAVTGRIDDEKKADEIAGACRNGQALIMSVVKEEKTVMSSKLYDLTMLQKGANRLFGSTAKQTPEYIQSPYEKKLATYPGTNSQFLSDDMGQAAEGVIEAVFHPLRFEENKASRPDMKRILNSKKVTGHHAITHTMEIVKADLAVLPGTKCKVLFLVANRLLCAIGEKHLYETIKAGSSCNGHTFTVSGKSVTHDRWKSFEDAFKRSLKISGNQEEEREERKLPELSEGQTFDGVQTKISEHFTSPSKHSTGDLSLSAMERTGAEDMGDDVERKGLDTPTTRVDITGKLIKGGFVKREKKQIASTEDGLKLITVLPDVVKSPKLIVGWENALTLAAKRELPMEDLMVDTENMASGLIHTYHEVSDEQKKMFVQEQIVPGTCPNCGGQVVRGKFGAYCVKKCGMNVSRIVGTVLIDTQVKDLLAGKKILLKGPKSKAGKSHDAYIIPSGTGEYHYTKNGEEKSGVQFKPAMKFPRKKSSDGKKK